MRSATATLITAATSKERRPVHAVLGDFAQDGTFVCYPGVFRDVYNDRYEGIGDIGTLTMFVESIEIDEALATELPAGARSFPGGYASAQATIVLSGSLGGVRLVDIFSGFDNPLSTLAPRIGCPTVISLGFTGTAGPETLDTFAGKIRSCSIDPDAGTATMVALDNRERFRTPVVLPVVYGDDHGTTLTSKRPGLNGQWLVDWIARRQGFFASPPARTGCKFLATLHGSAFAEVGTMTTAATVDTILVSDSGPVLFGLPGGASAGETLLGITETDSTQVPAADYTPLPGITLNNGDTMLVQAGLVQVNASTTYIARTRNAASTWSVLIQAATGHLYVTLTRNGATAPLLDVACATLTAASVAPGTHYLAVHLAFTATGAAVHVRVDGSDYTGTLVIGNSTGSPDMTVVHVEGPGLAPSLVRDVQITTGETWSTGMFDDDFIPTAILDPSLNELTSTPIVDTSDPWLLVQQIADAEQGFANFDGDTFVFRNRDFLTGGAAVATITTDGSISFANLKQSASSDEAIDTVNNIIGANGTPYTLDATSTVIWGLSELVMVPAGGTVAIPAEFPGPVYTLASLTHRASQTADGTGGDITTLNVTATPVTANSYNITISNPTLTDAYLVGNLSGGTPGEPNLNAVGRCTRPSESSYRSIATDAASVALYGAQPLDVADTPWRQSAAPLDAYTAGLLANLKDPHPEISELAIVGDPRLQLGDRVRVADPDGLTLDDDFFIVALKTSYDASGGFAQSVTLRQA